MKRKLTVLMITAFVDMLGLIIIFPLLPFYAERLGASAAVVGALVAAFSIAQLIAAPAWGRISDIYGRRPAILGGLFISAVGYVLFAFADTLPLLFLSRIIQGLGGGTIGVVQAYVADTAEPRDRAKALGWLSAVTSLGAVVGPAIGSVLVRVGGHVAPGIGSAVLCVLVIIFAWRFLSESRAMTLTGTHTTGHRATGVSAIREVLLKPGAPAPRLIWIYAIAIGAFYGTVPILPLVLGQRLGVNEQNVGYIVMYIGGMGVIVRMGILGKMIEWLGEAQLARVGMVALAAGLVLVAAIHSYPMMILSLTLMPIGTAFIFPSITAMLSHVVKASERGLYMGVQHTFGGISRVLFPLATGYTMDRLGLGFPYVVAGIMVAATLLLTVSLEKYAQVLDAPSASDIAMTQTMETPITPPSTPAATSS